MIMSLPSLKGTVFFIYACFNTVSFRGQKKKPGPRPDWSPLGYMGVPPPPLPSATCLFLMDKRFTSLAFLQDKTFSPQTIQPSSLSLISTALELFQGTLNLDLHTGAGEIRTTRVYFLFRSVRSIDNNVLHKTPCRGTFRWSSYV